MLSSRTLLRLAEMMVPAQTMVNAMQPSKRRQRLNGILLSVLAAFGASVVAASGSAFPTQAIKFIVPLAAGSPPDVMARLIAPALSARLGQPVIVENRPGGGGTLGTREVVRASPDGYTLLFAGANHTLAPALSKSLGYDSIADFAPIGTVGSGSWILVVSPSVPARSIKELVA